MKGAEKTEYFHICTDGRLLAWMFQDDKDFIAGINRIAICHIKTMAVVICFVLMDNHVHFVLKGTLRQCKEFINLYKRLTGRWIMQRYGITDHLRLLPTDIIRITTEESLLNTIAYIDRNAVVAGYKYLPGEYPWGSAKYMFREKPEINGRRISSFTRREHKDILHSNIVLPGDWIMEGNMILPTCFMDFSITESFFKSPIRYTYFLSKKNRGNDRTRTGTCAKDIHSRQGNEANCQGYDYRKISDSRHQKGGHKRKVADCQNTEIQIRMHSKANFTNGTYRERCH